MALPKISLPIFSVKLPSSGAELILRPFNVAEEKLLLMAMVNPSPKEAILVVKQIISNCLVKGEFDVDEAPSFDLEYLFLKIRINSIGSRVEFDFKARPHTDCPECQKDKRYVLDLREVEVQKEPEHNRRIMLTDQIGVMMKYPKIDIDDLDKFLTVMGSDEDVLTKAEAEIEQIFTILANSIDYAFDAENVYDLKGTDDSEIKQWLGELSKEQFRKLIHFYETMPKLKHTLDLSCKACGHKEEHVIEGLFNFFG